MAEMPKMQEQFSAAFGTFSRQREKARVMDEDRGIVDSKQSGRRSPYHLSYTLHPIHPGTRT
jgi:hypothetical protein